METDRTYYLGPAAWSQSLLQWAPFAKRFNEAAKAHDIAYGLGGNKRQKRIADDNFAQAMLKTCGWNPFAYTSAFLYYVLVRTFGTFYFKWSKN